MDWGNTYLIMEINIMGSLDKIKFRGMVYSNLVMVEVMMENGVKDKWMVLAFIDGQMDRYIKDNIKKA